MRAYSIAITALTIDAPTKWTDNILSQHDVPGVAVGGPGLARRISYSALLQLALTRDLHGALGLSVREALELARLLLAEDGDGSVSRGAVRITLDRAALERRLDARLRAALESAPVTRRGRPASRRAK